LLGTLVSSPYAHAHADLDPLHDHRVVALHVTPQATTLTYTLAFSAASSADLVKQFDKNDDHRLSGAELDALREHVRASVSLAADLDGEKISPTAPGVAAEVTGADGEAGGLREIAVRFTSEPPARTSATPATGKKAPIPLHTLRLTDATKLPRPGDFHVRLSAEGGARIASVDHKVEMRLSFLEAAFHRDEPCQASGCGLEVSFEGGLRAGQERQTAPGSTASLAWLGGLVLGLVLVLTALVVWSRRRVGATGLTKKV
jgi:hypothetical protein